VTTRPGTLIFVKLNFDRLQHRPEKSKGGYHIIINYALVQYLYMGKEILKIG